MLKLNGEGGGRRAGLDRKATSLKSTDFGGWRVGCPFSSTFLGGWLEVKLIRFTGEPSPVCSDPCLLGESTCSLFWSLVVLRSSSSPSELAYDEIPFATCVAFFGERGLEAPFLVAAGLRPLAAVGVPFREGFAARPAGRSAGRLLPAGGGGDGSLKSSESDTSLKVTVFFFAGPRKRFDLIRVELVVIVTSLGPWNDVSSAARARAFL